MHHDASKPDVRVAFGPRADLDRASSLHRAIGGSGAHPFLTNLQSVTSNTASYGLALSSQTETNTVPDDLPFILLSDTLHGAAEKRDHRTTLETARELLRRSDDQTHVYVDVPPDEIEDLPERAGVFIRIAGDPSQFQTTLRAARSLDRPVAISLDAIDRDHLETLRNCLEKIDLKPDLIIPDADCLFAARQACDILVDDHDFSRELLHRVASERSTPPGTFDSIDDLVASVRAAALGTDPDTSKTSSRNHETTTDHSTAEPTARNTTMNQTDSHNGEYDGQKDIAIVGIGAKMPKALSADDFWNNIKEGVYAIRETPKDRWDPELYYDPDPEAPDKTYSKIGGWITDFEFDRKYYRIPPFTVQSMDESQLLAMDTTREALEDAGYLEDDDFDGQNCATILGNTLGGDLRDWTNLRIQYPEFEMTARRLLNSEFSGRLSQSDINDFLNTLEDEFKSRFNSIDEDSMPGELPNVIAGRVANAFNLRGPNFVTDAACASSLASVEQAVRGLRMNQFDTAVTGGVDRFMGPSAFVKFCKIGALSPDGSRPFDENANGFVMGEGCGVLVLKRLRDAVEDDDDIIALIRGCGSASDGAGKGITAPNPKGQKLAVQRAYNDAGYGPRSISLYEAHGTSTPIGDPTEFKSTYGVVSEDGGPAATNSIAMGSVKSMIGHLKAGAGAASLIKVASALRERTLPPTLNVETPHPELNIDDTCFHIQQDTEQWSLDSDLPRRAGISAFGFGGTDYHMTLEEWDPSRWSDGKTRQSTASTGPSSSTNTTGETRSTSSQPKTDQPQTHAADQVPRNSTDSTTTDTTQNIDRHDSGDTVDVEPNIAAKTGERPSRDEILERMIEVLCEQTGYDPAEIETDFELEADLGVDTVKQAEILAEVREEYGLAKDEDFRFSEYPTLERLADYVEERFDAGAFADQSDSDTQADSGNDTGPATGQNRQQPQQDAADQVPRNSTNSTTTATPTDRPSRDEILERMTEVLCEQTGYDPAEIETDFELEADLGVDTVKQAEILAEVREEYGLAKDEDFRFSDYPTLERLADYVEERFEAGAFADQSDTDTQPDTGDDTANTTDPATDQNQQQSQPDAANQVPRNSAGSTTTTTPTDRPSRDEILERMTEVLCEQTGYDPAEIETDFELEADLGVDTVKQAEILAEVREEYGLAKDEDFRFSDYPTLERLADYVEERFDAGAFADQTDSDTPADTGDDTAPSTDQNQQQTQQDAADQVPRETSERPSKSTDLTQGLIAFTGDSEQEVADAFRSFKSAYERSGPDATKEHRVDLEEHSQRDDIAIPDGNVRLALAYGSVEELEKQLDRTEGAFGPDGTSWRILQNQGVYFADDVASGRIAMQFPGQGTQYLGMLSDLKEKYSVVQRIFDRADEVMRPVINENLSDVIDPDEWTDEAETKLRQTEYTQPAVLTADIALLKLIGEFGIEPDVVSGHSLGEYGALVAAGVMSFEDALRTVARRGTAMAEATPMNGDCGLMASIPAGPDEVQRRLEEIDGYVVCANKNCPKQTIIAGLSEPVEQAVDMFEDDGYMVQYLNVSHAFHTKVVAEGSKPLREHLESMDINPPKIPVLTNVTGGYHPTDPDEIRDLMAEQVASPVEWMSQVRRMHDDGARIFIEVGPKSALTTFISSILQGEDVISTKTNHPKDGGVPSLLRAMGRLWAEGVWTDRHRAAEAYEGPSLQTNEPVGSEEASPESTPSSDATQLPTGARPSRDEIFKRMTEVLCEQTGYDPAEIETDFELEADLGVDTVKQAEILAEVREEYGLAKDEDFRFSDYPTLERLADYVEERFEAGAFADQPDTDARADTGDDTDPTTDQNQQQTQQDAADQVPRNSTESTTTATPTDRPSRDEILERMTEVLCEQTGYDPAEIETDFELEADLGVDTVKQAEILAEVREEYGLAKDEDFRFSDYPTLERLADYVEERFDAGAFADQSDSDTPAETGDDTDTSTGQNQQKTQQDAADQVPRDEEQPTPTSAHERDINPHDTRADIVVSGGSLGLPGTDDVFSDDAVDRLLDGNNFIGELDEEDRKRIVSKQITRLRKHEGGGGELEEVTDTDEVVKLAARAGSFDFDDWGVPKRLAEALDHTSRLAFAAGIEALRDAGLPLVPKYRETQSGKKLTEGWKLPDKVGDETGIIFASAFAGQDAFADELEAYYTDDEYEFNHRLLLRMLGMANARFAEYVGARGPNTKINNACASTTTAIGMAHDWIARDRCKRVVILSADDATSDTMMEWVGSGFLATGAASTESDVEEAALPFDKRRDGMIVGMGAVGIVVEEDGLPEQRGLEPIADVLSTHFVNSGHHPTRLDVDHIAGQVDKMLSRTEEDFDLDRHDIADKTVFVSHETYTPARGGSADAEIESIRRNFGDDAERIVIANTKGYTGHAQGASIEEMLAVKALQHRRIPAIANFEVPDPNLGNLRLSEGGDYDVDYALRLAAGFGSQLALVMYRFRARQQDRVFDERRREVWLRETTGMEQPNLHVDDRTLRVKEGGPEDHPTPPSGGSSGNEASSTERTNEKQTTQAETDTSQPTVLTSDSSGHPSVKPEEVAPDYLQADLDGEERNRFKTEAVLVEADTSAAYDPLELKNRLEGKRIVIFAGPMLVTNLMRRAAERCGADVLVLEDSSRRSPLESDETVCNLKDEQAIREQFDSFGPVDGIINLLGFGREDDSPEDVHTVARQTFHVARAWRNHLSENPGADQFMTSVTGMGGRLGFDRATSPLPVCGAVCGLTKGLAREWPEANVRVVDVARDGLYPDLCQQILAETFSDVRSLEVGLLGGVRYLPVAVDADEIIGHGAGTSKAPTADSVILITGGAKGITSRIGMDLARRFNCKLALVGRTELTFEDPLSIDMDEAKAEAKKRIEERGDRVTPVKVRDELYPLKSQRTIRENMNAMTDLGADVSYFSCDVSDRKNVTNLIDRVRQHFGRIDGVIHAAGVEDSKLIHDKDPAAFDKVFNAKAIGGLYLWDAVAEFAPDFFVTFSSVVARFGNAGQADYAGANEVLNKLVAQINATSDVHGLSIDWTAWEDVGMAAGGSVETILRRNGVEFLPPAIGAPILGDALEQGLSGECMVAAGLGKLSEGFNLRRSEFSETAGQKEPHRPAFQGKVVEETTNPDRIVVERVFDPERDRFLEDHVYEGQPVLPGVMGVEMMVEVAEQLANDQATNVLDVAFDRAIKLHRGDPIRVIATAERIDENQVSVTLSSEREAKTGRMIERDHFTATVVFGAERRESDPAPMLLDDTTPYDAGFDRPDIYRRFFHTGSFRVIESVAHLNDDVVIAYGRKPTDRAFKNRVDGDLISDPMVREMAFQTAGIWGMVYNRQSYLPYAIGKTTQYGTAEPGETVCIRARRRHDAEAPSPEISVISFDLEVRGDDGRLLQLHTDCQMVGHRNLDESECFPSPDTRRMTLRRMSRPEADALLADQGLEPNDVLTRQEQQDWKRLRSERRRGEWLAARIAAKDLACRYVLEFQGVRPQLEQVEVVKDDNGAPHLSWVDAPSDELKDVELPNVTVTHAEGVAIAAIAAPGTPCRVGVDLESIEKRSDGFADNYFTEVEQNLEFLVDGEAVDRSAKLTALWSIKEAVSKALGLGLKLALGEIVIEELRTADGYAVARVTLNGKAREEAERLRATNLDVHVRVDGGFALASARLAVDASADTDKPSRPSKKQRGDGKTPKESGNGHEPAVQNSEAKPRHSEFAAVAALLKHKGLLDAERNPAPKHDDGGEKNDRSLPSWRS